MALISHNKYLIHYGVKGMKWGVRREANRRVREARTRLASRASWASREITESEYKTLSAKPIHLGSKFNRVSGNSSTNLSDFAYVTTNKDDHNRYIALLNPNGPNAKLGQKFSISIQSAKEVVSPGMKERVDSYISVLDDKMNNGMTARDYILSANPNLSSLNNRELGLKTYQTFSQSVVMQNPITSLYFDEIKKKGYNAVVDDADRDFVSKTPVIIFPKESSAKVTEVIPLTPDDTLQAALDMPQY